AASSSPATSSSRRSTTTSPGSTPASSSSTTASSQPQRHEDAVGILLVVAERAAVLEAEALVEALRGDERSGASCLEAQALVLAAARHREDVNEHRASRAAPPQGFRRAHRFHLAMAAR